MLNKILFACAVLFIFAGCSEKREQVLQKDIPAIPIEIIKVKSQNIPIWLRYTAKTEASSSQEIRARVQGILEEVYYKDGENVKKAQKLFKIEQTEYIAALIAAKAKKRRDLSTLKLAQANVNRYRPIVKEGLAARIILEQYEAEVESLKADIIIDNASIKQAKLELSYTIIKSPISGQASRRLVDIGNLVGKSESTVLTTIKNIDPLYAYFAPSEEDFQKISRLKKQDKMHAFIEINYQSKLLKPERIFGYVNFSDNTVDSSTSTVSMRAQIPNTKHQILPGTFVYVNVFVTDKFTLIGLPPQVLLEEQRGKYVYVLDKEDRAKRVYIEPVYDSRFFILVKEGNLKTGDRVVINALVRLKPGLKTDPKDVTQTKGLDAILKQNNLIPLIPKEKE